MREVIWRARDDAVTSKCISRCGCCTTSDDDDDNNEMPHVIECSFNDCREAETHLKVTSEEPSYENLNSRNREKRLIW